MEKSHRLYLVYLSLMFALVLAVVPLPAEVKLFRPDWPLLALFGLWLCRFGSVLAPHLSQVFCWMS
jgi:cell shape-determining protein MreD